MPDDAAARRRHRELLNPRPLVPLLVAGLLLLGGCSSESSGGGGSTTEAAAAATQARVIAALADEVIVPGYNHLVESLELLRVAVDDLCAAPSAAALATARREWKDADVAFRLTRAGGIGPASDRRLNAALGFFAGPEGIEALLASADPVDAVSVAAAGGGLRGLSALETALFANPVETLTTPAGSRRCEYAASVASIAGEDAAEVLADWTDGYRNHFVRSMDPHAAVGLLVNELSHRLEELDDQTLRVMSGAAAIGELPQHRQDGPASFRMAEQAALLEGIEQIVGSRLGQSRLLDLVGERSSAAGEALDEQIQAARVAMASLPTSVTDAFGTPELSAAAEAVAALAALVSTEVTNQLGVTLTFRDADAAS